MPITPITPKPRRAQARPKPPCRQRSGASVYDGTTHAVTLRGKTFDAISADKRLIAKFRSRREAPRPLPGRHA
jgi:hypothetical protein